MHSIIIHKVNYVPEALICLILWQQWDQQAYENNLKPDGAWCSTKSKHCILYWNQESYKRTIPWDADTNTGCMHSAPCTNPYHGIVAAIEEDLNSEDKEHVCFDAVLVLYYEDKGNED